MAITKTKAQQILLKERGVNYTPSTKWFVGVSSTAPNPDGSNFTEPSGGLYARIETDADTTDWVEGTDINRIQNATQLAFVQANADWLSGANLIYGGLWSAVSGGTLHYYGPISSTVVILSGSQLIIPAGGAVFSLD